MANWLVIYLLKSLRNSVPTDYVRSSYFAFFQSIILYGIILWGNSSHVHTILLLQKKAVRAISCSDYRAHCRPLFVKLRIMTVVNWYIYYALVHTKVKLPTTRFTGNIHSHNTRNKSNIFIPFYRLSKSLSSYEVVGQKLFNKIPQMVRELPLDSFKQKLYNWLVVNPFYELGEYFDCDVYG